MVCRFKLMLLCTLVTTALYGMDHQKESEDEINIVRTCNLDTIREKLSPEHLTQHAPEFLDAAMPCENAHAILEIFNKKVWHAKPGAETFAHHFNKNYKNKKSFTGSPYLDILMNSGKIK